MSGSLTPWRYSAAGAREYVVLRRVSVIDRTVRYERTLEYDVRAPCNRLIEYGPTFTATAREWERAL